MSRLSSGKYTRIDDVLYRIVGNSASNSRNWVLVAVDPTVEPGRREIPGGTPGYKYISPSATYRGTRLDDLEFLEDGQVAFIVWEYPHQLDGQWPDGVTLHKYGNPERAGDGYWTGTIACSELADFDDGLPEEWRRFLPAGDAG
ncbi:hypothetical protein GCM10027421_15310 [Microbacterium shaanxiense]